MHKLEMIDVGGDGLDRGQRGRGDQEGTPIMTSKPYQHVAGNRFFPGFTAFVRQLLDPASACGDNAMNVAADR